MTISKRAFVETRSVDSVRPTETGTYTIYVCFDLQILWKRRFGNRCSNFDESEHAVIVRSFLV